MLFTSLIHIGINMSTAGPRSYSVCGDECGDTDSVTSFHQLLIAACSGYLSKTGIVNS